MATIKSELDADLDVKNEYIVNDVDLQHSEINIKNDYEEPGSGSPTEYIPEAFIKCYICEALLGTKLDLESHIREEHNDAGPPKRNITTRQRKTNRNNCSQETLDLARKMIFEEGESKRKVAELLGIHESTLRNRLKKGHAAISLGRFKPTFTHKEEKELISRIQILDGMFHGITPKKLRSIAYDYAEQTNVPHRFNKEIKMAGKDWVRDFMSRNPDIVIRRPTSTSIMHFDKSQMDRFYGQLENILLEYNLEPCRIYNVGDSCFSVIQNKAPKERVIDFAVVCGMSASGIYVPPVLIFAKKSTTGELLEGAPENSITLVTELGKLDTDSFLDWLIHFKHYAKPTETCPILLILDNYSAYASLRAVDFCKKNFIHVIAIPSNTTQKMQPLAHCFFPQMKEYFAKECEKWKMEKPISIYQVVTLFKTAYMTAANFSNAMEGFKVAGIHPFNRKLLTNANFLGSTEVTEELKEHACNISLPENNETCPSVTEGILNDATASQAIIPGTSTCIEPVASPQKLDTARRTSNRIKRFEIIAEIPCKRKLDGESEVIETKTARKTLRKLPPKPKKSSKSKKKLWRCPCCQDDYKKLVVENRIQCSSCSEWWHRKCNCH